MIERVKNLYKIYLKNSTYEIDTKEDPFFIISFLELLKNYINSVQYQDKKGKERYAFSKFEIRQPDGSVIILTGDRKNDENYLIMKTEKEKVVEVKKEKIDIEEVIKEVDKDIRENLELFSLGPINEESDAVEQDTTEIVKSIILQELEELKN